MPQAKILSIEGVSIDLARNLQQIKIKVEGTVSSPGWTNGVLVPWVYIGGEPEDGILHFNFMATPPESMQNQVITKIKANLTITDESWLNGIAVHSSTSSIIFNK